MGFFERLPRAVRSVVNVGRDLAIISSPPRIAELVSVRPRPDAALVRAWRARRDGEVQGAAGVLHYHAGRDYVVEYAPSEFGVVREDIFHRLYRPAGVDRYEKRTDVVLHYFKLPHAVRVRTLEGVQDAAAGDWIMQGPAGELWPVKPEKAQRKYEAVD